MAKFYECGICDHVHPWEFNGDCRDDANRFTCEDVEMLFDEPEVVSWEERQRADQYGDHVSE